jgi:hypothetical protein
VLRLRCPTGCPGTLARPFARRGEPAQCPNCRAWLAAPATMEDATVGEALLLAAPGAPRPGSATAAPHRRRWAWLALALLMGALVAVVAQRARAAAGANASRPAPTNPR